MAITIKDIARKAKVSTTAVSLAINGAKGVSEKTRQRILRLARELNYQPNLTARSLISKRSHTIGYIVTNITDPFYSEVALGMEEEANKLGYKVILTNTSGRLENEAAAIATLQARGVDGIIFSTVTVDDPNLNDLIERKFPFVVINRVPMNHPAVDRIDSVIIDSYSGGYKAVEHLYRLGHDHLAIVAGSMQTSTARERTRGGRQALADHGLKFNPRYFFEGEYDFKKACAAAKSILKLKPRPTAVFAHDDNMAFGVREAVLSEGLRIPEDLALVGFDDINFADLKGIELTTVSQKKYEMGIVSTQVLVNKIEKKAVNMISKVVLEAELVIRRSCGFHRTGYVR
ncbi:MAG: LacI family DNA-binding transcriptional regulator [Thermodesulfobacteriota bacterium]